MYQWFTVCKINQHRHHFPTSVRFFNSKFFISGDIEQTDRYRDKKQSGLYDAIKKFNDVSDVGVFEFGDEDVVRNPLISKLLKKYEENRD